MRRATSEMASGSYAGRSPRPPPRAWPRCARSARGAPCARPSWPPRPRCARAAGHHGVHEPQALEGVLGVVDVALVHLAEVVLDVAPGQCRAAEQHRVLLRDAAVVHLLEVVLHDHRGLHQQPGHPDRVDLVLLGRLEDGVDRLLDADVDHVVTVVRQDDVDQVLADVVDVALDRGQQDLALAGVVVGLHVRLEVGHRRLHHLGRGQHERQLHLAGAEQLADGLHPGQQRLVDDLERVLLLHPRVEVGLEPVAVAVDDAPLQAVEQRQGGELLGPRVLGRRRRDPLEDAHEVLQRVGGLRSCDAGRRPGRGWRRGRRRRSATSAGSSRR